MPRQDPRIKAILGDDGRVKSYEIRVNAYKPNGERYQAKRRFTEYKDAKTALDKLESDKTNGAVIERSRETLTDLLHAWLDSNITHGNWTLATIESYRRSVEREIVPIMGGVSVQKITLSLLQDFQNDLLARKKAEGRKGVRTVRIAHQCLREALDDAVNRGVVSHNVADKVKLPRDEKAEQKTWTPEQTRRFLSVAARSAYGPLWSVVAATGMRRGEALGLRWCDVDFDAQAISVRQTIVSVEGKAVIKATPKTKAGQRTIPLHCDLITALRDHRATQLEHRLALGAEWHANDLVFAASNGNPISPRNAARDYERWIKLSGLPRIRIHDQRHSFATEAIRSGADLKAVSEMMGHSDLRTTLNTYHHVSRREHEDVMERVGKSLFGA